MIVGWLVGWLAGWLAVPTPNYRYVVIIVHSSSSSSSAILPITIIAMLVLVVKPPVSVEAVAQATVACVEGDGSNRPSVTGVLKTADINRLAKALALS